MRKKTPPHAGRRFAVTGSPDRTRPRPPVGTALCRPRTPHGRTLLYRGLLARLSPRTHHASRDGTAMHKFRQPNTLRFRLRLWAVTYLPSAYYGRAHPTVARAISPPVPRTHHARRERTRRVTKYAHIAPCPPPVGGGVRDAPSLSRFDTVGLSGTPAPTPRTMGF